MPNLSAEYMAGFVDGEGTLNFRVSSSQPCVSISNTNLGILELIRDQFGGTITLCRRADIEKHKQAYMWRLISSKAVEFVHIIYPFLVMKKEQAELFFLWETHHPGKGGRWYDHSVVDYMIARSRELNHKGPELKYIYTEKGA